MSRKDDFTGSTEFFRALESKLGQIIDGRSTQYFTIPATPVSRARAVLEQVTVEQEAVVEEVARAA